MTLRIQRPGASIGRNGLGIAPDRAQDLRQRVMHHRIAGLLFGGASQQCDGVFRPSLLMREHGAQTQGLAVTGIATPKEA